ncbi:hypothetical protein [Streptomyces sp. GQFP]|uniref:hypothetical protein n=1 Tax=Streptomyces sp. GQFP TaxID=2907545 RepID=UPI001F35FAC0|nr:hypothetical protein [Streptomyces sp. GQFP]UIX35097.1 hypothetical protein LUX31_36680 [Streptomyces sp. GQFP]
MERLRRGVIVYVPTPGTLVVDTSREGRVGEFRGTTGPYWSLRPVCGGTEWDAVPEHVRLATPAERLSARTARENARSRGEVA